MNRPKYIKIFFCFCFLTVSVLGLCAQYLSAQSNPAQSSLPADLGRDNPFASIPKVKKSLPQPLLNEAQTARMVEESPDLSVELITLKYLDAKSAGPAFESMCSRFGKVAVLDKVNSLIICDIRKNLDMILAEVEKIDKPSAELFVETVTLKFLEAKNLKPVLDKMVSQYGSIATNDKTNSLIISDTKENLVKILTEVGKADKTPQQIMIEVAILDVQLKDDTEIGINWDLLSNKNYDISYRQNFTTSRLNVDPNSFNTTGLGGEFSVISGKVRNVINMIQEKRDAEIIASPRAMVVSGQSANIKAVEEIPYKEVSDTAQGGAGALTSTQFKNVGITLQVTATITDDNDIFLTVDTEQNVKTSESTSGVPVVDTRKANTSLLLRDGQIVVIGGLRRQEKTKEADQIPILGDLPIIGLLFKNVNTVINNSELIVLLSPHIYKGEAVPPEAMTKYNEIKNRAMLELPDGKKKEGEQGSGVKDQ